jgi:hypothetical protein
MKKQMKPSNSKSSFKQITVEKYIQQTTPKNFRVRIMKQGTLYVETFPNITQARKYKREFFKNNK